jgi:hypothetical protein
MMMRHHFSDRYASRPAVGQRAARASQRSSHMGAIRIALLCLLALVGSTGLQAQTGTLMPYAKMQWFDNNGNPCNACKLYTYAAGTLTPLSTYSDSALSTPNANPVVADASGRMTVYLSATSYKFILKTSADVTIWTQDNVASTALATSAIGVGIALVNMGGDPDSPITATSYPSGTTFDKCAAGTLIFNFNSANLIGTYALEGMLLGNGGTVTAALVNLSDGSPDTPIVTIAGSNTTGDRQVSSSVTFAAAGTVKNYGIKVKMSAGSGRAWMFRLVRTS